MAATAGAQCLYLLDRRLEEVWRIAEGGRRIVWVEFGPGNRLAWADDAGSVRLGVVAAEDGALTRVAEFVSPDGAVPGSVAFSPDGTELAIGCSGAAFVDVVDTVSGSPACRLSAGNVVVGGGDLSRVAWAGAARGGATLYAGGTLLASGGRNAIIAWREGQGPGVALGVADDSIAHIAPLSDGGALYLSTFPSWGRLAPPAPDTAEVAVAVRGAAAAVVFDSASPKLDLRRTGLRDRFLISRDGARVAFVAGASDEFLTFDLARSFLERGVAAEAAARDHPHRPEARRRVIGVTRLRSVEPEVNGVAAPLGLLGLSERALSADVAADGSAVLVGADFSLSLLDARGAVVAQRALPAAAWALAIAPDAPVAVAALGDGTLRWFALDGVAPLSEIAALFAHADRRRWIAWRSDGRFTHAPEGGGDFGGYVGNREARDAEGRLRDLAGDWLSMDELYAALYSHAALRRTLADRASWPDIVARRGLDAALAEATAPRGAFVSVCGEADPAACAALAPVAQAPGAPLVGALDASPKAIVTLSAVEAAETRLDRLRIYRNGRLAADLARDVLESTPSGDGRLTLSAPVWLTEGANDLVARLVAPTGAYREVPLATVTRLADETPVRRLHLLLVGVANYAAADLRLFAAAVDAQDIGATLIGAYASEYDQVPPPIVLTDGEATRERVLGALAEVAERADGDDAVFIYVAGHGETGAQGYSFLPYDVSGFGAIFEGGVDDDDLVAAMSALRADAVMLVIDTCYADAMDTDRVSRLAHDLQVYFLMASADSQQAQHIGDKGRNGALAHLLLDGLNGGAAPADGSVDALSLGSFLLREVAHRDGDLPNVIFRSG